MDALNRFRHVLACAAAALLVLSAVLALCIGPMVEAELMHARSHPPIRTGVILNNHLGGGQSDDLVELRMLWGVADGDRSLASRFRHPSPANRV